MPAKLTADMRADTHRALLRFRLAANSPDAVPAGEIDDTVARLVACPVQRSFDETAYAALLTFGVRIDE